MRVNVYSQELTNELEIVETESNTGITYFGIRFILHSSEHLHHTDDDDDRSAITFWLPSNPDRALDFANVLYEASVKITREIYAGKH